MPNVRFAVQVDSGTGEAKLVALGKGFEDVGKKAEKAKGAASDFSGTLKGQFGEATDGMVDKLGPAGKLLAALGPAGIGAAAGVGAAAGAIGVLAAAAQEVVRYAAGLQDASARTDMTVESIQRLTYIGKMGGVAFESIEVAAVKMQKALVASPEKFTAIGLSAERLKGLSIDQQFIEVAAALAALPAGAERTAAGLEVMGKGFISVAPVIKAGLVGMTEEADIFAGTLSGAVVAGLDDIDDATTRAAEAWASFKREAGLAFIDAMGGTASTAESIRDVASAIVLARTLVQELGDQLARPEVQAFFSGARGAFGGMAGVLKGAGEAGGAAPTGPLWSDQMTKTKQEGMALTAQLTVAIAQGEKAAADAAKKSATEGLAAQKALNQASADRLAINDYLGDDQVKLARDEAEFDKRNREFIDARGKANITAFEAEMDRRKKLRSDSIDAYALQVKIDDAAKKARDEAAKKQEEIARQAREDMADAFMSVSMALGVIDSQLAKVLSRTAAFGAEVARIDWSKLNTAGTIGIGASSFSFGYEAMKALSGDEAREEDRMAWQQAILDAADAANELNRKAQEAEAKRLSDLDAAIGKYEQLREQARAYRLEQTGEGVSGLAAQFAALGNGAAASQERMDRLGRQGMVLFNALIAQGVGYIDAFEQMGPAIDAALAAANAGGFELTGAFGDLASFRALVSANKELVSGVQGWGAGLEAARMSGMSLESFNDGLAEARANFADLTAAGFTEEQALRQMAPGLLQLQKSAAAHGWALDAGTQGLIDKAQGMGAFEGLTDPMDKLVEISNQMLQVFYLIAEVLGGTLTPEMQKYKLEAEQAAKEVGGIGRALETGGVGGGAIGGVALTTTLPSFAHGTRGFEDFGRGTLAVLHGYEAVTPASSSGGMIGGGGGYLGGTSTTPGGDALGELAAAVRALAAQPASPNVQVAMSPTIGITQQKGQSATEVAAAMAAALQHGLVPPLRQAIKDVVAGRI